MNQILITLAAAGIFFVAMGLRGIFGYLKNNKISDVKFDWRTFLRGSLNPAAMIIAIGALAALILAFIKIVTVSGIVVTGLDQISIDTLITGLFIADIGAIGLALKEGLLAFGLSEKQITQIQEAVSALEEDQELGINITSEDGEIIASAETITKMTVKEQLAEDKIEVDDGEEVEPGKGSSNTYPNPYRDAAPDTLVDPSTCYNRECVSYAAWKIAEAKGAWPKRTGDMNARNWIYRLPENGYKEVSSPQDGGKYVGVLPSGTYGHVVWFESGNTISEYNYNYAHTYGVRSIALSQYRWFEIVAAPVAPVPAPTSSTTKAVDDNIINAVIRGEYGNNPQRSANLTAAGYDAVAVQAAVDARLSAQATTTATTDTCTVKSGDTLGQIILDQGWATNAGLWGASGDVARIAAANGIADANQISIGQVIKKA